MAGTTYVMAGVVPWTAPQGMIDTEGEGSPPDYANLVFFCGILLSLGFCGSDTLTSASVIRSFLVNPFFHFGLQIN